MLWWSVVVVLWYCVWSLVCWVIVWLCDGLWCWCLCRCSVRWLDCCVLVVFCLVDDWCVLCRYVCWWIGFCWCILCWGLVCSWVLDWFCWCVWWCWWILLEYWLFWFECCVCCVLVVWLVVVENRILICLILKCEICVGWLWDWIWWVVGLFCWWLIMFVWVVDMVDVWYWLVLCWWVCVWKVDCWRWCVSVVGYGLLWVGLILDGCW